MAVVQMLVERADGHWEVARACPMLVPVLSLGRRMQTLRFGLSSQLFQS